MERRDFLQRIGTALALAMTPSLTRAGTLKGPDLDWTEQSEGARLAAGLASRLDAIRRTRDFPRLVEWVVARGHDPELPGKIVGAMWLSSTFRDMPQKARRSPEVQQWAMRELPMVSEAVFEVVELIDGLSESERRDLVRLIQDEPELVEQMHQGFDAHAARRGVEPERIDQVRMVTEHTAWRLKAQSADAVIDDYVSRFDRLCRRSGIDRRRWREGLAREVPAWLALDVLCDADSCEVQQVAEQLAEVDAVDALSTAGTHLGIAMDHQSGRPGVGVEHVLRGSPADRAGLKSGDRIVAVDGNELAATELIGWLVAQQPDQLVQIEVSRHGERLSTQVSLGTGPADRIAVDRPRAAVRGREFAHLKTSAKVLRIGLYVLGTGGGMFVVGLILIGLGGGYDVGVGVFGTVLTVGGIMVMAVGLFIMFLALLIYAFSGGKHLRPLPAGR